MKTNENLARLGPRIKLFRRQMQEWNMLLIQQSQIRLSTKEHDKQKVKSGKYKVAILQKITDQALHLVQVMACQTEERQQMMERHQQEEIELEQIIKTHVKKTEPNSN